MSRRGGTHLRLREATSAFHHRVEEQLDLLGPNLTIDLYRVVLRVFYGYYCADLPTITQPADEAGCLYVIEGASLGGQIISRILERRLGIVERNGGSFFACEGPRTASRWAAVLAWIEEFAAAQDCSDAIVEVACETFRTMARWREREKSHS